MRRVTGRRLACVLVLGAVMAWLYVSYGRYNGVIGDVTSRHRRTGQSSFCSLPQQASSPADDHTALPLNITAASWWKRSSSFRYTLLGAERPLVTVAIVFGGNGNLLDCVSSVLSQSLQAIEVYIVYDGVDDDGAVMLAESGVIHKVHWAARRGLARAYNFIMRESQAEYIYLMDPAMMLSHTALEKMMWFLVESDRRQRPLHIAHSHYVSGIECF